MLIVTPSMCKELECDYYLKKPIPIAALKMNESFEIETLEGTMKGECGDYLMKGTKNELYICKKDIFKESYDKIEKDYK